jgi:hypothetical protein
MRMVQTTPFGALVVYHGDTTRKSKAEPIKIENGDSSKDADITIPLSKLHTIRGRVTFKSNGEGPPTAELQLLYADNRERARVVVATDGEFALAYVPEGNYILQAAGSNERIPTFEDDEGGTGFLFQPQHHSFIIGTASGKDSGTTPDETAEIPVAVSGDVSGLTISVPDPPVVKTPQAASPAGAVAPQ